jgi:salicylate hydroxylase
MGQVHLSHRFESFEEVGNEVVLHFENGTSATCDVLIGVDGIRSAVRRCFLDKRGLSNSPSYEPYWSGTYAYRGLIPVEELEREFPGHLACKEPVMVSID